CWLMVGRVARAFNCSRYHERGCPILAFFARVGTPNPWSRVCGSHPFAQTAKGWGTRRRREGPYAAFASAPTQAGLCPAFPPDDPTSPAFLETDGATRNRPDFA